MGTIVYAGTSGGVLVLREKANGSWSIANRALEEWGVTDFAVTKALPNRVLAATRGNGVWLSEDYGQKWSKPNRGRLGPGKVWALALDPGNTDRIYAGCEPIDVFLSSDLGRTWERLTSLWEVPTIAAIDYPAPHNEAHVRDLAAVGTNPCTLFAPLQVGGLAKSSDGGRTWRHNQGDVDADLHTVAVDPANSEVVVAATGGGEGIKDRGRLPGKALYRSNDGGESWQPTAMEIDQWYAVSIAMHPQEPRILYSSVAKGAFPQWRDHGPQGALIRSIDGGGTWHEAGTGITPGAFAEAITVDEWQPQTVFAGTRKGQLFVTRNGGDSWAAIDVSLPPITGLSVAHD